MQVFERIKMFRNIKGWSQEYVANQLEISLNAYGCIERGDTDVNLSRLKQIASLFEIELSELFNQSENMVLNLGGTQNNQWYNYNHHQTCNVNNSDNNLSLKHELEKQVLIIEMQNKAIAEKDEQIASLKKIIELLESK